MVPSVFIPFCSAVCRTQEKTTNQKAPHIGSAPRLQFCIDTVERNNYGWLIQRAFVLFDAFYRLAVKLFDLIYFCPYFFIAHLPGIAGTVFLRQL